MTTKERLNAVIKACPKAKKKIKELFKEIFLEEEKYMLIPSDTLSTESLNHFVYIGVNHAPSGFNDKCLVLNNTYDWDIISHDRRTVLIPKRKGT